MQSRQLLPTGTVRRASNLTKAFLSRCSRLGKPAGTLSLDLSKAFDKVVCEKLFGKRSGEINIETHLLGLGLSQAAAKHMAAYTDKSCGLLREIGVSDVIAELVADLHDGAWFHLAPSAKERARAASLVPCC